MSQLWNASYRLSSLNGNPEELAVSLRRSLFTAVTGAAVSKVRIKDAPHEFSVLPGIREDVLEIVRNLSSTGLKLDNPGPASFELSKRGPCIITASDLALPAGAEVVEPDQHLATLDSSGWLVLSGEIVTGTGFQPAAYGAPPGTVHPDCNFAPVKRAVCTVEPSGTGTDTAQPTSILVSLATDGRATTREALDQALQVAGCPDACVTEVDRETREPAKAPTTADFSKAKSHQPFPSLAGLQKAAFVRFIDEELPSLIGSVFPITASDGSAELDLVSLDVVPPESAADDSLRQRGILCGRLTVNVALRKATASAPEEREVCLGDLPWMTERETFIVDGLERVIVPTLRSGQDPQETRLTRLPCDLLRSLRDPLEASLTRAKAVLGELLARPSEVQTGLDAVADFLPIGRALVESLRHHPCSQVCDSTNPLSSLAHLRRISALGPDGPTRESAGFPLRAVDPSHYGRLCHIETPEGPNIGLINSFALHAEIGEDGLIRTPYLKVEDGKVTDRIESLTAAQEEGARIGPADLPLDEDGTIAGPEVRIRINGSYEPAVPSDVQYLEVSPVQPLGPSSALIPFLAHDDANRALMGANMQRQAVPLLSSEAPLICSGVEGPIARASGATITAKRSGTVTVSSGGLIRIEVSDKDGPGGNEDEYRLRKFAVAAEGTAVNERALVAEGDTVEAGQPLAESTCSERGLLALGRNLLVAFMPWEGYNFEDGIVISERLVREDVLTSIHTVKLSTEARVTTADREEIARPADAPTTLDERGIVRPGTTVAAGDILVAKTRRRGDRIEDCSLTAPEGAEGRVVLVRCRDRAGDDASLGGPVEAVEIEIAQYRKVEVGDKLSNRHGAKGVVSAIVPEEDLPHLPDGTPVDMLLNPLGVPSRMNLGQILETHLGWAAAKLNRRMVSPPFAGADISDIEEALREADLPESGAVVLRDGRDGRPFDYEITVGALYVLKLNHMVADKIHARSIGPYSVSSQQPTGGKANFGGQRFGEMEVWAAEAHGAGRVLQELLTVKSDEVSGRAALHQALSGGHANVEAQGLPHAAKTLLARLRGVGFEVRLGGEPEPGGTASPAGEDRGLRLSLASPEAVRAWSNGQVTSSRLVEETTGVPVPGGIFCEEIFGEQSILDAAEHTPEVGPAPDAPEGMGHIELAVPVCHPWVLHSVPELIAGLLGIEEESLKEVAHYRRTLVELPDGTRQALPAVEAEEFLRTRPEAEKLGTGGPALARALAGIDLQEAEECLSSGANELLQALVQSGSSPDSFLLRVIPVIPTAYRVATRKPDGTLLAGGLNELYARLVARNEACQRALDEGAPEIIVQEKARGLQEAVEMLFGNGVKRAQVGPDYGKTSVASLSDLIRGMDGGLRSVGKRVDFSGRSVIASGPDLKLTQCGLPGRMARELFRPFIIDRLVKDGAAADHTAATALAAARNPEAERALAEVIKGKVVLLNRAPTIHRYGLQAFEPVLTDHKAIRLHPLVCLPFNADFDGDQMAVHLPLSDAAQAEARQLMTPLENLFSSRSGAPLMGLTQDLVLGLCYLTAEKPEAPGAGTEFPDRKRALGAYESGEIALHAPISVADGGRALETTAGRLLFNSVLPEGVEFVNQRVDRRTLDALMVAVNAGHGAAATAETLERLKELGFRYVTQYGASIGKDRLKIYAGKAEILSRLRSDEAALREQAKSGELTDQEAAVRGFDLWTEATHEIGRALLAEMEKDWDGFNPAYLMHASGARGNAIQLRQLNGIRGLMVAGPDTHSKLTTVPACFMEGLDPWQHFVSSFGARRGLMDSALKVADAGYLERKLVTRAEDLRVVEEDCGTGEFAILEPLLRDESVMEEVDERAAGRITARAIVDPATGQELVPAGQLVSGADRERIQAAGVRQVAVRSVLSCESEAGVCAKCYGANPATGELARIGDAVGLVAAHCLGEPAIQLTLQTFYLAVRPSTQPKPVKGGLPRLAELERTGAEIEPSELVRECTAIYREQGVRIHDKHFEVLARAIHRPVPRGFLSRAVMPPEGETPISVLTKAALTGETDPLLGQRERVLFGRRV